MGTGRLDSKAIQFLTGLVKDISGDFAEVGVLRGDTFKQLIPIALSQNKKVHAFDSFCGMNDPGPLDGTNYPKGRFDIGGVGPFRSILEKSGFQSGQYMLWPGYVPSCFELCDEERFSFIYIDLDHAEPTLDSIEWAGHVISDGGIIGFDDYFPGSELGPSYYIDKFIEETEDLKEVYHANNQIFFKW